MDRRCKEGKEDWWARACGLGELKLFWMDHFTPFISLTYTTQRLVQREVRYLVAYWNSGGISHKLVSVRQPHKQVRPLSDRTGRPVGGGVLAWPEYCRGVLGCL